MASTYNLPNKLPGEKVVRVIRRHKFILFRQFLMFCVLAILPIGFFLMAMAKDYSYIFNGLVSGPAIVLGTSAYYLFIWLLFFFQFVDYYLDVWIITNERIIDIVQGGFFSRTTAEQMISRVQDVTSEVKGIIPTLLNYGNVYIQTAGEMERFTLLEIPETEVVRELVIKMAEEHQDKHGVRE